MIGERIQEVRKEREMSERELAKKADVSQGYISQIEHNSIVPSMNVLLKISNALGVPFASLAAEEEKPLEITVISRENRTKIKFAEINTEYEFLTPFGRDRDKTTQIEMIHYKLSPKSWCSDNLILYPESAACSVVLEGMLEYHIGTDVYSLEEGDCIYIPPKTSHKVYNPGDTEMTAIVILTPAYF